MKEPCKFCKWKPGDMLHDFGCPNEAYEDDKQKHSALEAWHRGWSAGVEGKAPAQCGNDSYLLGYSRGVVKSGMVESGFDPNADFDSDPLDDFFADL